MNSRPAEDEVICYTDGSKQTSCLAGAGWAITRGNSCVAEKVIYTGTNSVFISEVTALTSLGQYIKEHCLDEYKFFVYCDSMSAIQSLNGRKWINSTILECREVLSTLKIRVNWIKGHNDSTGNELADVLAKKGCSPDGTCPEAVTSPGEVRNILKAEMLAEWKKRWRQNGIAIHTKRILGLVPEKKLAEEFLKTLLKKRNLVSKFVTGHSSHLRYHAKKLGLVTLVTCRLCGEEDEKLLHLMEKCPALGNWRWDLQGSESCFEKINKLLGTPKVAKLLGHLE